MNVHLAGWPIDDRQSTLATKKTALADGGMLLSYTLAPVQAPLDKGRVQARRDDGYWEIRGGAGRGAGGGSGGGTRVLYETSYDAGGSLPVSLVQRSVRSSVAESLAEIRAAAELLAGAEAPRAGTDSSERKRADAGGSE